MKKILLIVAIVLFMGTTAHADYTLVLKNEGGTVIKSYLITTNQVAHLQKTASRTGVSILDQFESAIANLIITAKAVNKSFWQQENDAYVEEQSRQP